MCGFAGFVNLSGLPGLPAERRAVLSDMTGRIAHRGPDDETYYDDGSLALGFRRLSIIDVDGGQQPLWNEDRTILTVVNGEIYNHLALRAKLEKKHRFSSKSDSEVLLHLYEDRGLDMLDNVNGIFAAAIWDTRKRRMLLCRDRLGVKPLYYSVIGDMLLFGSELKALLAHPSCPRELDWQQLRLSNLIQQPEIPTYVKDVHHLPAGHMLVYADDHRAKISRYWSLSEHLAEADETVSRPPRYYVERYSELLSDSVSKQLMSDVPLGIFLSGGIDSSLIAAAASRLVKDLHCFTIAEDTTAMTGDLAQAYRVAGDLSFPLHPAAYNGPAMLDELGFDLNYLEYMIWCADSPHFITEWFYKHELYRYAKTRFPDLKVILTGTGADEFAGGYSRSYKNPSSTWQGYLSTHIQRLWNQYSSLRSQEAGNHGTELPVRDDQPAPANYHHAMTMNLSSLHIYNLQNEDRMSAVHGIEARVPFLDHRLVELLASVPLEYHEQLFWDKQIVREQLRELLPSYPVDFPKIPFIYSAGNHSVQSLETAVLTRTFRPFIEKYVQPGDQLLPRDKLEALYKTAISGTKDAHRAEKYLMRVMQTAIFRDSCEAGYEPPSIPSSSPLRKSMPPVPL